MNASGRGLKLALLALIPLGAVGWAIATETIPPTSLLLTAALCFLMLAPAWIGRTRSDNDILENIRPIGILYFVYYPARALYFLLADYSAEDTSPNLAGDVFAFMDPALLMAGLGFGMALIAYRLPIADALARFVPRASLEGGIATQRVYVIWIIGVSFKMVQIARGNHLGFQKPLDIDYDTQAYVDLLSNFSNYALFLAATAWFRERDRRMGFLAFAVSLPVELLYAFVSGSKTLFIVPIYVVLSARHYAGKRLTAKLIALSGAIVALTVFPVVATYRMVYGSTYGQRTGFEVDQVAETARGVAGEMRERTFLEYLGDAAVEVTNRFPGTDALMVSVKLTPDVVPYKDGRNYFIIPAISFLPRAVWPDKPKMGGSDNFGVTHWGISVRAPTAVAGMQIGHLYLCFGWLGVAVGMFILGIIWRFAYSYLRPGPDRPLASFIYAFVLLGFLGIENDIPAVYGGILREALLLAITAVIARGALVHRAPAGAAISRA